MKWMILDIIIGLLIFNVPRNKSIEKAARLDKKRNNIAKIYDHNFSNKKFITPLVRKYDIEHAYHLYVVKINFKKLKIDRKNYSYY